MLAVMLCVSSFHGSGIASLFREEVPRYVASVAAWLILTAILGLMSVVCTTLNRKSYVLAILLVELLSVSMWAWVGARHFANLTL